MELDRSNWFVEFDKLVIRVINSKPVDLYFIVDRQKLMMPERLWGAIIEAVWS